VFVADRSAAAAAVLVPPEAKGAKRQRARAKIAVFVADRSAAAAAVLVPPEAKGAKRQRISPLSLAMSNPATLAERHTVIRSM
jgi:hypothetical protein